jgi:multiple sugar transport system ATP-binding protein
MSFGEVTLTPEVREVIGRHPEPENVIVGLRPEHIHDAALIDGYQRISSLIFEVTVDLVESLGSDKYVYFTIAGPQVHSARLDEVAAESEVHENRFVARVPTESKASTGQLIELAFDPGKLAVFDADSGVNLTVPAAQ